MALQKKICMIGATGVGKTSLIRRFVQSIYSEKYHATIGVKIDKKDIIVDGKAVTLLMWDLQGEDDVYKIRSSFLRGASGYFLVADLTNGETLQTAVSVQKMLQKEIGDLPFLLLLNKSDLENDIRITDEDIDNIARNGWRTMKTSAKSGDMVEAAFTELTRLMITSG